MAPLHFSFSEDYFVVRKAEIDSGRFKSVRDLKAKPCAVNAKGVATEWMLDQKEKVMMDQQEFNLRLGYLKYTTPKPIKELVDLSHAEAAVKQLGRK